MPKGPKPSGASTTTPSSSDLTASSSPPTAHSRAQTPTVPICSGLYRRHPSSAYNRISAIPEGVGGVHPEANERQDWTIVRRRWNVDGYEVLTGPSHHALFRRSKNSRKGHNNNNLNVRIETSRRISLRTSGTELVARRGIAREAKGRGSSGLPKNVTLGIRCLEPPTSSALVGWFVSGAKKAQKECAVTSKYHRPISLFRLCQSVHHGTPPCRHFANIFGCHPRQLYLKASLDSAWATRTKCSANT